MLTSKTKISLKIWIAQIISISNVYTTIFNFTEKLTVARIRYFNLFVVWIKFIVLQIKCRKLNQKKKPKKSTNKSSTADTANILSVFKTNNYRMYWQLLCIVCLKFSRLCDTKRLLFHLNIFAYMELSLCILQLLKINSFDLRPVNIKVQVLAVGQFEEFYMWLSGFVWTTLAR